MNIAITMNSPYATLIIIPTPRISDKPTDTRDSKDPIEIVLTSNTIRVLMLIILVVPLV